MSTPKWNSNDIENFLRIYKKYDILWDVRHECYSYKNKRETTFEKLLDELVNQGFKELNVEILRKKIKIIKTVYRQELGKIEKSRKSGAGSDDLYKPKLSWFAVADSYLNSVTASRPFTSILDYESQDCNDVDATSKQSQANKVHIASSSSDGNGNTLTKPCKRSPNNMKPPAVAPKKGKVFGSNLTMLSDAILHLQQVCDSQEEDEFDIFGNHVAAQLRRLPLQNSIRLQEKIQSLITKERIACMEAVSVCNVTPNSIRQLPINISTPYFNASSPASSEYSSTTETRSILEESFASSNDDEFTI